MRKWSSRLASIFIIFVLILNIAGCAKKDSKTNSDQPDQANSNIKVGGNFNSTGLPIMKQPITLKLLTYNFGLKSFAEKEHYKQMSEETNVFIEWEEVIKTAFDDKLKLAISSNDLPDALYANPTLNYSDSVESGLIIPLDEYINKFAPNEKKMLELYPSVKMSVSYTGDNKIYAYAGVGLKPEAKVRFPIFMNKVWLERLGLKAPITLDEFYNVLNAFKNMDPNGNGEADEVPLLGMEITGSYMAIWGMIEDKTQFHTTIKDGKLIFNPTDIRYKEALFFWHKLFEEGLLEKDTYTKTKKDILAKGNKKPAIFGAFSGYDVETAIGANLHPEEYEAILPLKGPYGDRLWPYNPSEFDAYKGLTVFKDCKYPEAAIRWVDHLNDGVNAIKTVIGPENLGWSREEGIKTWRTLEDELLKKGMAFDDVKKGEGTQNGPEMWKVDQITGYRYVADPSSRDSKKLNWSVSYSPYLNKETWPSSMPISPSTPESKEIEQLELEFETYLTDFIKDIITNGQADQKWDAHLKKCKDLQVDRILKYYQQKYDEILKMQKK